MFKNLKSIFNPKNKDIRSRIIFTLLALTIFAIGNTITVPGTKEITANLGFLEYLNAISGGGLKQFSIFGLGVMPYISASIVVGLLQMDIIPYFSDLKNDGAKGRQKLNQITRYMGIIVAFIQGVAMSIAFGISNNALDIMKTALIMTAGTAFLLWLGDRITQKGIGNGISLIIMAGIISTVPRMFIDAYTSLVSGASNTFIGVLSYGLFVIAYIAIIVGVIFMEMSERRIPIQYSNQTTSAYGARQTYIPFKLNSAGVMPVILASAVTSIISLIASLVKNDSFTLFVEKYLSFTTPVGFVIYMLLIFVFGYFYTLIQANPEELSKNLSRNGSFVSWSYAWDITTISA